MKTQEKFTDQELVERILNKETSFFELLIRRHNPYLYRIGKMYRISHEDTQDLMQETYIDAFVHLEQFENRASFRTWISKIMLNKCYKKSIKWESKNMVSLDSNIQVFDRINNFETASNVMNRELKTVIETGLLQIPEDYRTAFVLREINGLSVHETAEVLDITESNVKVRVSRAKSYLRTEIEKFYNKEEIFEFNLVYCDQIVNETMKRIFVIAESL